MNHRSDEDVTGSDGADGRTHPGLSSALQETSIRIPEPEPSDDASNVKPNLATENNDDEGDLSRSMTPSGSSSLPDIQIDDPLTARALNFVKEEGKLSKAETDKISSDPDLMMCGISYRLDLAKSLFSEDSEEAKSLIAFAGGALQSFADYHGVDLNEDRDLSRELEKNRSALAKPARNGPTADTSPNEELQGYSSDEASDSEAGPAKDFAITFHVPYEHFPPTSELLDSVQTQMLKKHPWSESLEKSVFSFSGPDQYDLEIIQDAHSLVKDAVDPNLDRYKLSPEVVGQVSSARSWIQRQIENASAEDFHRDPTRRCRVGARESRLFG